MLNHLKSKQNQEVLFQYWLLLKKKPTNTKGKGGGGGRQNLITEKEILSANFFNKYVQLLNMFKHAFKKTLIIKFILPTLSKSMNISLNTYICFRLATTHV